MFFNFLGYNHSVTKKKKKQESSKIDEKELESHKEYLSPEYYLNRKVESEVARKQDYFALGATIYYLKFCQN